MRTRNMTSGNPLKLIVLFSLPLMLGNAFQLLYTMVDTIVVGRFVGVTALAAMGAADWLNFLIISLVQGMAQGFSIKMAQDFGAQDHPELRRTVGTSIILSVIVASLTTIASLVFLRPILNVMRTPDEIYALVQVYVSIIICGVPIMMGYNLLASLLRAVGDSKSPLYAMVISSLFNVIADVLFVMAFHWGVVGAAVATVMAQLIAALYCFNVARRLPMLKMTRADFRMEAARSLRLIQMGLPMALQNVMIAVGGMILQTVVNGFGVLFIAGYTATNKLYGLLEIAATSFGYAMVTYSGQNYGAHRYDRIRNGLRSAMILGPMVGVFICAFMLLTGRGILGMFISGTAEEVGEALSVGYRYLCFMCYALPTLYALHVMRSNIQGLGDTFLPMLSGVAEFVMRVSVALVLPGIIGGDGVYLAEILAWMGADVVLIISTVYHMRRIRKMEAENGAV